MKKSLLLFVAAMLIGGAASAQVDNTLQFVDAGGNVVPDGSTVQGVCEEISEGKYQISTGLYVKNNSGEQVGASVLFNILKMDNGSLMCCFPASCQSIRTTGSYETDPGLLSVTDGSLYSFNTEWTPDAYGQCTAIFKLMLREVVMTNIGGFEFPSAGDVIAEGPSVTVNFVYDEGSTGINAPEAVDNGAPVEYYTIGGQKLLAPQKGAVNIVKYANGKTSKIVVK